ncbi:MAG TPA: ParB/RepB/Spo0J family partition protein [Solirubrobacteraceae bacterium]|nr:ParB/RepB/Spo0J family partition protein [Solirubrobacteraceae bacterium]
MTADQAEPQGTQHAYTLCDIPVSHIAISQNNPRKHFDEQELERLAHAMSTRGFNHPILVKPTDQEGYYEIIDGERRWRAAQQAKVELIPALVKVRPSIPGADLIDAMLANGLGISLDVVEEALGYEALIGESGYTRKSIADAMQIPLARVRERLLILDLPEKLRQQIAAGIVPLMAVKTLSSLAKIHPGLPEIAVKRVLDGPVQQWDEPTTWDDLVANPISVLIGGYEEQLADLPKDVFVAGFSYPISRFELDEAAAENLLLLCDFLQMEPAEFGVCFDRELLDQALALKAAYLSANKTEAIIVGGDVAQQLAGDCIDKSLKIQVEHAQDERENAERLSASRPRSRHAASSQAEAIEPPSEEQIEAGRKRALEEDRRLCDETIARNQRLGVLLIKHLYKVRVDDRVLKILTASPLAGDLGRIASRGARLSFPGWAELSTRKNGSTKAEYLSYNEVEGKAREFLEGASTAAEIAGRTLALLAAARWAKEKHAVADSKASNYTLKLTSILGDRGIPWREEAEELLDDILIEKLPPEAADPIREAKERRDAQRAEEERRDRERDSVVAEFLEKAPSLSRDDRHAEIARLRSEYGFSALTREQGRKLMEFPEPDTAPQAEEQPAPEEQQVEPEMALAA